ncbi:hypothetical protein RE0356_40780 [Prescottella equi]|nr:hypothetical protein RE0356_40780 [Prescottella equi]
MQREWSARADAAEEAVMTRHIRRVWGMPGTALAVVAWPAVRRERMFVNWHYWWQANLINCTVDAAERNPTARRRRRLARLIRGHRFRNISGWTNNYYDDMAWLALALERAQRMQLIDSRKALSTLESQLFDAWSPDSGGGIPWRRNSDFFNTPANGPAGLVLARLGRLWRAQAIADWIDETLRDPETGLIFDGIRSDGTIERNIYSYCQGTVLSLETELAVRMGAPRHLSRVHRLVDAIDERLTRGGVIRDGGGGDGGLFNGLLARYLALVALMLPGDAPEDVRARQLAAQLVLGGGGVGEPAPGRGAAAVRQGLEHSRAATGPRFGDRDVLRRVGASVGHRRTGPVGAVGRLAADGIGVPGVGGRIPEASVTERQLWTSSTSTSSAGFAISRR